MDSKRYSFVLVFANGSNQYYHFPCEYRRHVNALRQWKRHYTLDAFRRDGTTTYYQATEKQPVTPQVDLFRI